MRRAVFSAALSAGLLVLLLVSEPSAFAQGPGRGPRRPQTPAQPFTRLADGKPAEVYSAFNAKTVLRHFQWMRDYGIDGVFVQRFAGEVFHDQGLRQFNTVLGHCREGVNKYGRTYAVMYDLSGMRAGQMNKVIDD